MQIFGPYRVSPTQPTNVARTSQALENRNVSTSNRINDELDLSPESLSVTQPSNIQEASVVEGIRFDKVADIRRQIAEGTYDTDDKMNAALDRLLDEVG
ncbi:MAG: flagellar biosynthesis anti-sigma factor FlgM [Pirellulaceae bacterium]